MNLVFGICWGLITLVTMLLSNKYYVPFLQKKAKEKPAESSTEETQLENNLSLLSDKTVLIITICCSVIAALSAYFLTAPGKGMTVISGYVSMTIVSGVLSCIFVTDMQLKIIPNLCSIILLASKVVTSIIDLIQDREFFKMFLLQCVLTGIGCLIFLLIISKVTHGGIGFGDVKILSCIGFLCGLKVLLYSLFFALIVASVFSLALVVIKKKQVKDFVPFGPMLWLGFEITALLCLV